MVAGSVTSAATPGAPAWDVVVGERFIAAIAAPAPDRSTSALAEAAGDARVSVERLVGFIPTGGADLVESFAIVWWSDDPGDVTVVVRGNAVVDLGSPGGTRRFDARGVHPWHLAEFAAVVALRITAADAPLDALGDAPDAVRHSRASLRASSVQWAAAAGADEDAFERARSQPRPHVDADTILLMRRPPTGEVHEPSGDTMGDEGITGDSILMAHRTDAGDPIATTPILVVASESGLLSPVPAGPSAPAALPGFPPGFRIGTGPVRRVTGAVRVGRRPLPPRIPEPSGAPVELVAVESPAGVVSGTHLELRVLGERLVATDLRSTNGTIVRNSSGVRRMRAGESIVVAPGTTLDLGDGTIVEIVPSSGSLPD